MEEKPKDAVLGGVLAAFRGDLGLTLGEVFTLIETQKIDRYLPRRWENLSVQGEPNIEGAQTFVVVLASPGAGKYFGDGSA